MRKGIGGQTCGNAFDQDSLPGATSLMVSLSNHAPGLCSRALRPAVSEWTRGYLASAKHLVEHGGDLAFERE